MVAHRNYRVAVDAGRVKGSTYRMPGAPYANWMVVAFILIVTAMLSLDPDTRVALYVAPFWFGLLGIGYVKAKSGATAPAL
jgi:AAT family amino acid transporter/D-serine/D-alanine/glycine transporter